MLVILGGLVLVYNFFGLTAFFIGIGALYLLSLWMDRRASYSSISEPMSGWFADDMPHLAPPVEQAKLGRASTAPTRRQRPSRCAPPPGSVSLDRKGRC